MTTEDSPAVKLTRLEAEHKGFQNDHKNALKAFEDARAKASVEELLGLAKNVDVKVAQVVRAESAIAVCKREIAHAEWESKSQVLRKATSNIVTGVTMALQQDANVYSEFEVTGIIVTVTALGQPDQLTSVKPTGPGIPTPPKGTRKASSNGGGGRGSPLTVDGTTYASASTALLAVEPGFEGKMGRAAIVARLRHAGHTVTE